jgi:glucose-6-phosphate 1-dehydrogenase
VRDKKHAVHFHYKDYFKADLLPSMKPCVLGDNILFQRADSVEARWRAVQPFLTPGGG